jgi:uncharacterized protein (DUF924 family)
MSDLALPEGGPGWPRAVLDCWFTELERKDWFVQSDTVDAAIAERFRTVYDAVATQPIETLARDLTTARAAIIVLDQFPRNLFRDSAKAFETDASALEIAKLMVANGNDRGLTVDERAFIYLPFEHSESLEDQKESVALFEGLGHAGYLHFARKHCDIIARFGRFPHRNAVLGRTSTPEEAAFLAQHGRGF